MGFEVVELPVKRNKIQCKIILSTSWDKDFCSMTVICDNSVWTGQIGPTLFRNFSENLQLNLSEYIKTLQAAFSYQCSFKFKFRFTKGLFICMKLIEGFQVLFGKFRLKKITGKEETLRMIREIICSNLQYKKQLSQLSDENICLRKELTDIESKFLECIKCKSEMEKDLYKRFQLVINEKKRKIAELHTGADSVNTQSTIGNEMNLVEEEKNENVIRSELCNISESHSALEIHEKIPEPGPSKKSHKTSFTKDIEDLSMSFDF